MFRQSRAAVLLLYLLLGAAVLFVSRAVFVYYRSSHDAWLRDAPVADRSFPHTPSPRKVDRLSPSSQLRARARMQELQEALQRTNQLLAARTTVLNQKVAECRALQQELDASIAFVFSILGVDSDAGGSTPESMTQLRAELEDELLSMKSKLAGSESLQQQQAEQLAELQTELSSADLELAELQMAANQEIVQLQQRKREVEMTSRAAIVQFGPAAVPALSSLLADQRPHIRAWSAAALGDLGMDAQDAMPLLVELLTDPDSSVSENARKALAQIEP